MFRKLFPVALSVALLVAPAAFAQEVSHDPATVQDGAYGVEPSHTRVLFSISHMGFTTWYGEFTKVSGSLDLNRKRSARARWKSISRSIRSRPATPSSMVS